LARPKPGKTRGLRSFLVQRRPHIAVFTEERGAPTLVEAVPAADPAPLALAAFALTTFILSGHNAGFIPDVVWVRLALFYGGLVQLLAGMWEFRNRNVFGSTAFSTYGGFWMSLGIFVVLAETTKLGAGLATADVLNSLAWFLIAFAIFNTYMLMGSTRVSIAVFACSRRWRRRRSCGRSASSGMHTATAPT